ncbi:hypothetical protein BDP27DRAFT_1355772, partial [Rhodocollybia butyracea]
MPCNVLSCLELTIPNLSSSIQIFLLSKNLRRASRPSGKPPRQKYHPNLATSDLHHTAFIDCDMSSCMRYQYQSKSLYVHDHTLVGLTDVRTIIQWQRD